MISKFLFKIFNKAKFMFICNLVTKSDQNVVNGLKVPTCIVIAYIRSNSQCRKRVNVVIMFEVFTYFRLLWNVYNTDLDNYYVCVKLYQRPYLYVTFKKSYLLKLFNPVKSVVISLQVQPRSLVQSRWQMRFLSFLYYLFLGRWIMKENDAILSVTSDLG